MNKKIITSLVLGTCLAVSTSVFAAPQQQTMAQQKNAAQQSVNQNAKNAEKKAKKAKKHKKREAKKNLKKQNRASNGKQTKKTDKTGNNATGN